MCLGVYVYGCVFGCVLCVCVLVCVGVCVSVCVCVWERERERERDGGQWRSYIIAKNNLCHFLCKEKVLQDCCVVDNSKLSFWAGIKSNPKINCVILNKANVLRTTSKRKTTYQEIMDVSEKVRERERERRKYQKYLLSFGFYFRHRPIRKNRPTRFDFKKIILLRSETSQTWLWLTLKTEACFLAS